MILLCRCVAKNSNMDWHTDAHRRTQTQRRRTQPQRRRTQTRIGTHRRTQTCAAARTYSRRSQFHRHAQYTPVLTPHTAHRTSRSTRNHPPQPNFNACHTTYRCTIARIHRLNKKKNTSRTHSNGNYAKFVLKKLK